VHTTLYFVVISYDASAMTGVAGYGLAASTIGAVWGATTVPATAPLVTPAGCFTRYAQVMWVFNAGDRSLRRK
jgi:hypothetical protein